MFWGLPGLTAGEVQRVAKGAFAVSSAVALVERWALGLQVLREVGGGWIDGCRARTRGLGLLGLSRNPKRPLTWRFTYFDTGF